MNMRIIWLSLLFAVSTTVIASPDFFGRAAGGGAASFQKEANDLESDGADNIADTEVFIGTGAGTGNYAPLSGGATMTNAGVVTIGEIALESATVTSIADDEVPVGDGAASLVFIAIPSCSDESETLGYNTTTNTFVCNADAGAGGGMTSWTLQADDTNTMVVADGETVDIAGGTGVDTVAATGSPEQFTINLNEAGIEGFLDLQDLQGAVTDGQVPDDITIDLATLATTATTANAGDSATAFFSSGTIEHEYGGLEADVNAYDGLIRITGGSTSNVTNLAGLNTALGSTVADGAHTTDTGPSPDCSGTTTYQDGEGGCDDISGVYAPIASPVFTGIVTIPIAADPTTDADGEVSFDTDGWGSGYDSLEVFNGTASAYVVATTASDTPTNGQVPKWNTGGTITWEDDTAGSAPATADITDVSVTQTEFAELEAIGATTISAAQWAGVGASTAYGISITALADEAALQALITSPWADADVADDITASNYLPLAGGTLTGELVIDNLGSEFTAGDDHSDCTAFSATGGGIFFDDSEGIFKKCQDNVLTDMDTGAGTVNTADIGDVNVTQTELAELEAIGATTISAAQWTGLGGATTAGIALWDDADNVAQLVTLGLTATASEINTPLDGASVTLTEFQELEAIGATTISANQWAALGGIAETLSSAELDILDGVTATSAQLNYLNAATGTTGTTSTNVVFSTSPTLVTPALGTIASGVGTALTALNGENIQDDTIDDDSIDFADVTLEDLTLTLTSAKQFTLVDNNADALSIGSTGALEVIKITTTDGSESVDIAADLTADTITVDSSTDPYWTFDVTDADDTDWTIGTNADAGASSDDDFEFRTSATPGSGVIAALQPDTGDFKLEGSIFILEQADAGTDVAGYGQIWVNTATPNELWWTDDAGTDVQLGAAGSDDQTLAEVLAQGADANDVDTTSWGRLSGFDAGLYLDMGTNGVIDLTSDGTLELHSADWDISTTGAITGASGSNSQWTNDESYITATLTQEQVEDYAGGMWTGNTETGITVTYQDGDGTIDAVVENLAADTVDAITEVAAALKSGADATFITGTEGASGNCAEWNADGDLVDAGAACAGSDDQTLAEVLAQGADANDVDTTSWGRMEGYDAGLYLDWDADGVIDFTSDGTLELHSADWDISTTGTLTNTEWQGTAIADAYVPDDITIDLATLATTVTVSDDESTADGHEVVFTTDNENLESDGDLTYNPSTGTVTATEFVGGGSGLTGIPGSQDFADVLGEDPDGGDIDQTSLGKLEFFDAGLYLDADADGVMDITSDGTLELHSADWDISTTGVITGAGAITSDGVVTATGFTIGAAVITEAELELLDGETDLATQAELNAVDQQYDTEAELEAITGALFGTSKAVTSGYIWVADGVDFESVIMSGDATIATGGALTIAAGAIEASMVAADVATQAELNAVSALYDTEAEIEAITGALFGTSKAVTSGYIWVADGVDFESVVMSGDATIATGGAVTIAAGAVEASMVAADVATQAELDAVAALVDTDDELIAIINATPSTFIDVAAGGTGVGTLTDHGVLVGSGAADITPLVVGTNGQVLVGSTGADPVFATVTAGDALTATIGAGTLEFDFDGGASPGGDLGGTWGTPSVDDDSHNHVITNIDSFTKANLETQTSDVSDYAEADGDVFTGTHDFGGADDLEIPNGNNPTTDTEGQIAHDTDDAALEIYSTRFSASVLTAPEEITLPAVILYEPDEVAGIDDEMPLHHFPAETYPHGVTVRSIHIASSATCTDPLNFEEWSNNGTAWSNDSTVEAITLSGTYTEDDGTLADNAIAADAYLFVDLDDTMDDIAYLVFTVTVTINPGD